MYIGNGATSRHGRRSADGACLVLSRDEADDLMRALWRQPWHFGAAGLAARLETLLARVATQQVTLDESELDVLRRLPNPYA